MQPLRRVIQHGLRCVWLAAAPTLDGANAEAVLPNQKLILCHDIGGALQQTTQPVDEAAPDLVVLVFRDAAVQIADVRQEPLQMWFILLVKPPMGIVHSCFLGSCGIR